MTTTPQSRIGLTPLQLSITHALASGVSISAAAQSKDISRTTIHGWKKTIPEFAKAIEEATQSYIETLRDQTHDLSRKALAFVDAIIDDVAAPLSIRLKAALAVLNRKQWDLPANIGPPGHEHFDQ